MAEAEVIALKEALNKQAQLIQELSADLEEERKAAASGVDEALSMIFRLQEERALEKMEASQYKRMTEAKMLHAEESMAFLKESVLEKEIEIGTLKFQVEFYRQNMLRVGISNTDVEDGKMFETPRFNDRFRRHISMPSSFDKLNLDINIIDKNGPLIPTIPSIWSETGECSKHLGEQRSASFPKKSIIEEVACYPESQDEKEDMSLKLNDKERVISLPVAADDDGSQPNVKADTFCGCGDPRKHENLFKAKLGSIQIVSKCSFCSSLSSQRQRTELDSLSCSYQVKDSTVETIHSNIQDIYEIPNSNYDGATMKAMQTAVEGSLGDDLLNRKPMKYPIMEKGVSMNSLQACEITVCQTDVEELKQRVQKLEVDQWIMKEEASKRNNEHLNLVKQIHEQLNIIQSQTRVSKRKQLSRQDEILLSSITEAILSFAL